MATEQEDKKFEYVLIGNLVGKEPDDLEQLALDVTAEAAAVRKLVLAELERQESALKAQENLRAEKRRSITAQATAIGAGEAPKKRGPKTKAEKEAAAALAAVNGHTEKSEPAELDA